MKLKKFFLPVVLLLVSFAGYAQEDTSFANVYFVKSKFFLTPESKETLKAFIDQHGKDHHLWVVGRCDKWGGNVYNDWLSEQRANTVTDFLVANGFSKDNIDTIKGYGKRKPLAIDGTPKQVDDKNRVVTITGSYAVVQQLIETPPPAPVVKKPVDTTYLNETITLQPPYAPELLTVNKFPHRGDLLKTEFDRFVRNDSPFVNKKLYVAAETMEEPKAAVVVTPPPPPPPAPVAKDTMPVAKKTGPDEIDENATDLDKQVTDHLLNSKVGESLVIRGINFDFGSHKIIKKDKTQLNAVLYAMNQIPTLKLEIQGHICCWPIGQEGFDRDTKEYNLSYNRAKAVFDFLTAAGISADRLTYNGYGMKKPLIYPEKTKDDEAKNRRVEFKIVSK